MSGFIRNRVSEDYESISVCSITHSEEREKYEKKKG